MNFIRRILGQVEESFSLNHEEVRGLVYDSADAQFYDNNSIGKVEYSNIHEELRKLAGNDLSWEVAAQQEGALSFGYEATVTHEDTTYVLEGFNRGRLEDLA